MGIKATESLPYAARVLQTKLVSWPLSMLSDYRCLYFLRAFYTAVGIVRLELGTFDSVRVLIPPTTK